MKTTYPAVGVVVPVRNASRTLAAAIESVSAQDPAPADIVVVDGSSDDGSADVARSFPGVRVVGQLGQGLAAARNQGVREVAGEIIGFCDADDRWTVGSLGARLEHLARDSDCGAVIGHIEWGVLDGIVAAPQQASRVGRTAPGYTPGALLVRRSVFETVGAFDSKLTIGCDSDWFVRFLQSGLALQILPQLVLYKGVRSSSLSTDVESYRRELLTVARAFVNWRRQSS